MTTLHSRGASVTIDNARPKRASRADVARLAGTSTAVVSYVVNGGPATVSAGLRERVERAIKELDYRPNPIAQALRGQKSHVIALMVPDSTNRYFASLAHAVQAAAAERGYQLFLANTDKDPEKELAAIRAFSDRRVDGVIVIASSGASGVADALGKESFPSVLLDRRARGSEASTISIDNYEATRMSTLHLIEHGHERILHLSGLNSTAPDREKGYADAMREHGLTPRSVGAAFESRGAFDVVTALIAAGALDATAVLTSSDVQAIGVYRAAADVGLRIPEDLAVVGFDGIDEGEFMVPRLTTVRQPIEAMALEAVESIVRAITTSADPRAGHQAFHVELVVRESCGAHSTTGAAG